MQVRQWAAGAAIAALVIAALVWRVHHAPEPASAEPAAVTSTPMIVASVAHTPPAPAMPPRGVAPYPELGEPGLAHDDPLTAYKKANVYPPTSRPLTAEHVDLLQPNARHESVRPTDADDGVEYLFTADRYFVLGDETLTITLDVRHDGRPQPVAIVQAFAAVSDHRLPDPPRTPLALRGAGPLVATFAPAALGLKAQATIGLYVEFQYGDTRQRAHIDFAYTPAAGVPARFTGAFADHVEAGSLVVHAGVAVAAAGRYVIDCNLYDASDRPVAWTRAKVALEVGTRDVALAFFGKVLADQHAQGPFHIRQLRGARFDPGHEPDLEQMPPFAGTFTTAPYPASAFSDAEYDSPEKQHMIELLTEQQERGVHQGPAGNH